MLIRILSARALTWRNVGGGTPGQSCEQRRGIRLLTALDPFGVLFTSHPLLLVLHWAALQRC